MIDDMHDVARHVALEQKTALTASLTATNAHDCRYGQWHARQARSWLPPTSSLQLPRAVAHPSCSVQSKSWIVADWEAPYLVLPQLLSVVVPTI